MIIKKEETKYENKVASGKYEEIHLIVPKHVANKLRHVAKTTKKTTTKLLEEMVEAFAYGIEMPRTSRFKGRNK